MQNLSPSKISLLQQRKSTIERFRNRQTMNTNRCGWAVFSHVEFLFRDAHVDKMNTNTNTTSSTWWNLQHFFFFFSFRWLSGQESKMDNCFVECHYAFTSRSCSQKAWSVDFQLSDERLNELIMHRRLPSAKSVFLSKRGKPQKTLIEV